MFFKSNTLDSKEALEYFINISSEMIVVLNRNGQINFANSAFINFIGGKREDILKKQIYIFLDKESSDKLALLISRGEAFSSVNLNISTVGHFGKLMTTNLVPYKEYMVILGKNITEEMLKKNERSVELRKIEEERFRSEAILDNIGEGVISVNDRGEVVYLNNRAIDILGFQVEELVGNPIWKKIITLDQNNKEIDVDKSPVRLALFTKKRIYEDKMYYMTKDGRKVPVSVTATPLIVHNLVIGGVNVFRDITKEREIDRMKTEFISLASHQLRTPLSATKWFTELVMDDSANMNDEQKQLLNNIYQSNQRMIDLVNALLNISRIESGRIIIDPTPTDIKVLIEGVLMDLTSKIKAKNHNIELVFEDGLTKINIDPKLIRNVYMNLLTNSIKYTKEGGKISISVSKVGEELISKVSDNGFGIPQEHKKRVFEKFFRSTNILKVETDGSGLGLYLAKAIVESSGGRIWFESEEDRGTTFWFTLPISGSTPKKGEVSIEMG